MKQIKRAATDGEKAEAKTIKEELSVRSNSDASPLALAQTREALRLFVHRCGSVSFVFTGIPNISQYCR